MRVINFDRGSKRRLRQIRWTSRERTSLALLFLFLLALYMLFVLWDLGHEHPFSRDTMRAIRPNPE
jgi:preprotein translocase subunit SecE